MSNISLTHYVRVKINDFSKEIAEDAVQIMKEKAPEPAVPPVSRGLGSESTGTLKESIRLWNVAENNYVVGPNSGKRRRANGYAERVGDYAYFADKGRGPITTHDHPMVFKPSLPIRKDKVVTNHVSEMTGWNFTGKTLDELDRRFNAHQYRMFE